MLASCGSEPQVRVTNEKPAAKQVGAPLRTDFLQRQDLSPGFQPQGRGVYDMTVSGMSAKQQKDAEAVATSSLGYFACPDGQRGKLQNRPSYSDAKWRMQAKCG